MSPDSSMANTTAGSFVNKNIGAVAVSSSATRREENDRLEAALAITALAHSVPSSPVPQEQVARRGRQTALEKVIGSLKKKCNEGDDAGFASSSAFSSSAGYLQTVYSVSRSKHNEDVSPSSTLNIAAVEAATSAGYATSPGQIPDNHFAQTPSNVTQSQTDLRAQAKKRTKKRKVEVKTLEHTEPTKIQRKRKPTLREIFRQKKVARTPDNKESVCITSSHPPSSAPGEFANGGINPGVSPQPSGSSAQVLPGSPAGSVDGDTHIKNLNSSSRQHLHTVTPSAVCLEAQTVDGTAHSSRILPPVTSSLNVVLNRISEPQSANVQPLSGTIPNLSTHQTEVLQLKPSESAQRLVIKPLPANTYSHKPGSISLRPNSLNAVRSFYYSNEQSDINSRNDKTCSDVQARKTTARTANKVQPGPVENSQSKDELTPTAQVTKVIVEASKTSVELPDGIHDKPAGESPLRDTMMDHCQSLSNEDQGTFQNSMNAAGLNTNFGKDPVVSTPSETVRVLVNPEQERKSTLSSEDTCTMNAVETRTATVVSASTSFDIHPSRLPPKKRKFIAEISKDICDSDSCASSPGVDQKQPSPRVIIVQPETITAKSPAVELTSQVNQRRCDSPSTSTPASSPSVFNSTENVNKGSIVVDPRRNFIMLHECQMAVRPDMDGDLPIHIAVVQGDLAVVRRLIPLMAMLHADVDFPNQLRQTPLHLAVITKQAEIVKTLLKAGASAVIPDRKGHNAVHLAILHESIEILKILLSLSSNKQLKLDATNYEGFAPLHLAVLQDLSEAMQLLHTHGADVNVMDGKSGRTPLFHAAETHNFDLVKLLVDMKASVNLASYSGTTPVQVAHSRGFARIVSLLVKHGADNSLQTGSDGNPASPVDKTPAVAVREIMKSVKQRKPVDSKGRASKAKRSKETLPDSNMDERSPRSVSASPVQPVAIETIAAAEGLSKLALVASMSETPQLAMKEKTTALDIKSDGSHHKVPVQDIVSAIIRQLQSLPPDHQHHKVLCDKLQEITSCMEPNPLKVLSSQSPPPAASSHNLTVLSNVGRAMSLPVTSSMNDGVIDMSTDRNSPISQKNFDSSPNTTHFEKPNQSAVKLTSGQPSASLVSVEVSDGVQGIHSASNEVAVSETAPPNVSQSYKPQLTPRGPRSYMTLSSAGSSLTKGQITTLDSTVAQEKVTNFRSKSTDA